MEAKLKDRSILHVDAEERIYAQSLPGGSVPIVIGHAEGERLLIEFAEQQQREVEQQQREIEKYKELLDAARSLIEQVKISGFQDDHGHSIEMNNAYYNLVCLTGDLEQLNKR